MLMRARSDAQVLQTVNTLTYTAQMVESSRADKEKAAFNEVHMCMQHAHALPMHTHMHRTLSHCGDLPHRCVLSSRWIGGRVRGWWPGPRPSRAASTHTSRTASLARMPLPRAPALMPPLPRPPVPRTRSRAPPSPSTAYPPCPHPPPPPPPPYPASSGKRLSHEWELDVCKWVTAAGGTEEEAHELFEAFQKMYKEAKRGQRGARPKQQIERIVEPCVVGGDFMADGPRAAVAE